MSDRLKLVFAVFIGAFVVAPCPAQAPTFTVRKVDIGGTGGTDYLTADPASGRVFVSRGSHVMVVDGVTGKVLGDIPDTPRNHGIALSASSGHGFITSAGDSTVTMFDLKTLAVIRKIRVSSGGLDGIMHDEYLDRIILTNHSRPTGTLTVIDAATGDIVGTVLLAGDGPEGAASDGKGRLFVNLEGESMIEVIDLKTMKSVAKWPLAPCEGPTGIAINRETHRIFSGCSDTSVVVDANTGKVVGRIPNGAGVDALGHDPEQHLIYIPAGRDGTVTVVREGGDDQYPVVATVQTMRGVKTIAVDTVRHVAYGFTPEYGPAPDSAGHTSTSGARRRSRGPIIAAWFFTIAH